MAKEGLTEQLRTVFSNMEAIMFCRETVIVSANLELVHDRTLPFFFSKCYYFLNVDGVSSELTTKITCSEKFRDAALKLP